MLTKSKGFHKPYNKSKPGKLKNGKGFANYLQLDDYKNNKNLDRN